LLSKIRNNCSLEEKKKKKKNELKRKIMRKIIKIRRMKKETQFSNKRKVC
jgi:hypothetical protein